MANQLKSLRLFGTTTTGGALTVSAESPILGWLVAVQWIDGTFDDGVDAVVSVVNLHGGADKTLLTLTDANSDAWYHPTTTESDATGTARTATTLMIIEGLPKLAVTSGGSAKTGGCVLYYTDR